MAGIDEYTKLILHMDGADEATTFTDSSLSPHTFTAVNNAQIDTAQKVFGTASGLFDGTDDYIYSDDHVDWTLGSGDFTIDFRVRFNSVASTQTFINHHEEQNNTQQGWMVFFSSDNNLYFRYSTTGSSYEQDLIFSWTPVADTWYHVAIVRNGNNLMAFVGGTQIGETKDVTGKTIYNSSEPLRLGVRLTTAGAYDLDFNGWLDEVRLSVGIARWTENFTPPTEAYSGIVETTNYLEFYRRTRFPGLITGVDV